MFILLVIYLTVYNTINDTLELYLIIGDYSKNVKYINNKNVEENVSSLNPQSPQYWNIYTGKPQVIDGFPHKEPV